MKVVAAILIYENKVLAFRRPYDIYKPKLSLKFEFPGGKIKKNETNVLALQRELREELELTNNNYEKYYNTVYDYIDFKVDISFYISNLEELNFKLNFHNEYKIVDIKDLKHLDWLEADYEVINYIQRYGIS